MLIVSIIAPDVLMPLPSSARTEHHACPTLLSIDEG